MKDKISARLLILCIPLFLLSVRSMAQDRPDRVPEFWYEYKLKEMTLDQKIGQLFMAAAYSNKGDQHTAEIEELIIRYHIGGLIFFQDDPLRQAWLTNYYQSVASTPLMIGIDGEWGPSMRLKDTRKFPYHITLGALRNDSLIYAAGAAVGQQCKRLGIHINFAPVVDINVNPDNPIIGFRSFGENKEVVARAGDAFSRGMQSEGILTCAKHFPGHGDVFTDSHLDLPVVDKSLDQLDTGELYPFRYLIDNGVSAVMVAHIHFPQLDQRPNRSASLSALIIDSLLRKKMNFQGLIFTDALNMKGVSKYYTPGHADLEAFLAGNDILLFSENIPAGIESIRAAILNGQISEAELDKRVLRILRFKYHAGLAQYQPVQTRGLMKDLRGEAYDKLLEDIAESAVSVARDRSGILPVQKKNATLIIALGDERNSEWEKQLRHAGFPHYLRVGKNPDAATRQSVLKKAAKYQNLIISLHQSKVWKQQDGGYTANDLELIRKASGIANVLVAGFCNPYVLRRMPLNVGLIAGYEDLPEYHKAVAGLLNGTLKSSGSMPIGLLHPGPAKATGYNAVKLQEIDGIVQQLLMKKAAPGCRVLVMKDGEIIYNRSYGTLNYNVPEKVNDSTVYDIASITKVAGTTLAVMKLYEEGRLRLNAKLGEYLEEARGTNKEHLLISDILQHRAGLQAWIPFYKETLPYIDSVFCATEDSNFCVKVADGLFMLKANKDTIYKRIFSSPLESRTYRYSDLSMILMQLVVERISGVPLDRYLDSVYYTPMGLRHIGFNPWKKGDRKNIAPTQLDRMFRQQELCGYVHDPAAAMLGGVSGHAGLFSNTYDLAAIMQMLMNEGIYNGVRYLETSTIRLFTSAQRSDSRRGLGFDKPELNGNASPASTLASPKTFGHTGFTGTCAWADPENGIVYIFLSNRICPVEENKELINGNYRTRIQDVIYRSLNKP